MLAAPKMLTRSSNGFVDVPLSRLFAAVWLVDGSVAAVAASPARPAMLPSGPPFVAGSSSKSSKFSACCPATTVWSAFWAESASPSAACRRTESAPTRPRPMKVFAGL
jgi:hypothetical protein